MHRLTDLTLPLDHTDAQLREAIVQALGIRDTDLRSFHIARRGYDARQKGRIRLIYAIDVELDGGTEIHLNKAGHPNLRFAPTPDTEYQFVMREPPAGFLRPVVVGMGPCGLFAGLVLAQMGFKPIIIERGEAVKERTASTWGLWRKRELTAESNVQFGEGGAGTFSDGKLYSQVSDKQHHGRKVLTEFVKAGAPEEILYVSKPHIGTFRLVSMVQNMRANIIALGGEVRFNTRVDELLLDGPEDARHVVGVRCNDGTEIRTDHVVMALGHSARDTFEMLYDAGVYMEAKPFSMGFRIEHPQSMIDAARFGPQAGHPILGAADYKLVHHARNGRAVYSFCMCPGGTVVAATSEPERVVTNGMSQYSRNERNANSGIVCNVDPVDFLPYFKGTPYVRDNVHGDERVHPLAGISMQRHYESLAYVQGGSSYNAPAQLIGDYIRDQASSTSGAVEPSYKPGVTLTSLSSSLPSYAIEAIREALPVFGLKIRGFDRDDGILTGVETRTSSPLRMTRGKDFQSLNVRGLYPAGEGAGYAGGILSAGIDGIKVAEAIARSYL